MPENLSRIELRFGSPLPQAPDPSNIILEREDGSAIENAILDLPLLSADGRRLTLLLNPARLKTGLKANLQLTQTPAAGTRAPSNVRLEAAISASAESFIAVRDMQGRRAARSTELLKGKTL